MMLKCLPITFDVLPLLRDAGLGCSAFRVQLLYWTVIMSQHHEKSIDIELLNKLSILPWTAMSSQPLWLRCEKKVLEHRAALTPTTAKKLIDAGFVITVERDPQRIFADEEYETCAPTFPSIFLT